MLLKSLSLKDFRSYRQVGFEFSPGLTLVTGPNASGKTNLLEAIFLLATGKSFRAGVEREVIRNGCQIANIKCRLLLKDDEDEKLELVLTVGEVGGQKTAKKRSLVNGVARRQMDFVGRLRAVLFRPEDLDLVSGSPSMRRNYLDAVLEMTDREYRRASLSYQKGLRQRNKLLEQIREEGRPRAVLYFWDKLMIENGQLISRKRRELIDFVNGFWGSLGEMGNLEVEYDESVISKQRLEHYADQEVASGMTLVGPHRDDFVIVQINPAKQDKEILAQINTERKKHKDETHGSAEDGGRRDLAVYGSRGEQRLAVLSLKLAELEYVSEITGQRPVLLLDDIFSELDQRHRAQVLAAVGKQQTLITTTDPKILPSKILQGTRVIELD